MSEASIERRLVTTCGAAQILLPRRLSDERNAAATMTRCQELHIPCTPEVARKAVESALFRYYCALRQEFDLPADPRGIYPDHEAPMARAP